MDDSDTRRAELDARIARFKRQQSLHWLWLFAIFALGAGFGFLLAEWLIDPVTVLPGCGGIKV